MATKKATTKRRNPQDATLRNIRALKKQLAELRTETSRVLHSLAQRVSDLERRLALGPQ